MSQARTLSLLGSALSVNSSNYNLTIANNIIVNSNATLNNATLSGNLSVTGVLSATGSLVTITSNGTITIGNSTITNTTITVGNSTANSVVSSGNVKVSNATSSTTIGPGFINSSNTVLSGFTTVNSTFENITYYGGGLGSIGSGATINIDTLTSAVVFYGGNATGNFTINVRGNSTTTLDSIMPTGSSITVTLITGQGAGYYPTALSIDGVSQTIRYQYGTAFFSDPSTISAFTFTIIKIFASTYYVFGSQTRFT